MSQMGIEQVLAQIRSLSAQTHPANSTGALAPAAAAGTTGATTPANGVGDFASILRDGINQVNSTQQKASSLADAFERGTPGVELPQVMVELQRASVSFHALTEVRNRLISAYQDIMNIPL